MMSYKEWLEEQMKVIKANGLPDHLTTADQEAVLESLKFAGEMYDQYLLEVAALEIYDLELEGEG